MTRKRKNLMKIFRPSSVKVVERNPKRKNSKGCYVDPEELGKQIGLFNAECRNPDKPCIRIVACKTKANCGADCKSKLISPQPELITMIELMCFKISTIRKFRESVVFDELPSIGFIIVLSKLRNLETGDLNSAFSYLTTIIKNAYRGALKNENEFEILKVQFDKDRQGGNVTKTNESSCKGRND